MNKKRSIMVGFVAFEVAGGKQGVRCRVSWARYYYELIGLASLRLTCRTDECYTKFMSGESSKRSFGFAPPLSIVRWSCVVPRIEGGLFISGSWSVGLRGNGEAQP